MTLYGRIEVTPEGMECEKCSATVCLNLTADIRFDSLMACPNCSEAWLGLPGSSTILPAVKEFTTSITKIVRIFNDWERTMNAVHQAGFALSLEVREPIE